MSSIEYEAHIENLLDHWRNEIYDGVLVNDVLPATQIYAHASLQQLTDTYDVPAIFPIFSKIMGIHDHYGNALYSRLGAACTSIRNALQSVHARMDCHAAIASARRAHESLWQMFWIGNPTIDGDVRVKRVLQVTRQEIEEALRFFSNNMNLQIDEKLRGFHRNIEHLIGKSKYLPKDGWTEYQAYFAKLANEPPHVGGQSTSVDIDESALVWSMMSNMTHPNVVFDWIMQIQEDPQDRMDRLQLLPVIDAIGMVVDLTTLVMQEAKLPTRQVVRVNRSLRRSWAAAQVLLELKRRR